MSALRESRFFLCAVLGGALFASISIEASAQSNPPYNFVVVITDDQRWDTTFAMPNADTRLRAMSVRFQNAYTATPVCGPSRASLYAGGFRPESTGMTWNYPPNGEFQQFNELQTMATAFQAAGYSTLHLGKYINGYEELQPYIPPGWTRFVHAETVGSSTSTSSGMGSFEPLLNPEWAYHYRDHAKNFIDEFSESPFFIVYATGRPHWPSNPIVEDRDLYSDYLYRDRAHGEVDLTDKPQLIQNRALEYPDWRVASVEEEDEFHRNQLRAVHGVDRVLGEIMDKIDEQGLMDRTVFVFMSDHGFLWGEHGQFGKGVAYEESVRVPLLMSVPGIVARDDDHLVLANLDLPATLFDLAGISAPTEGTSLVPVLNEPNSVGNTEIAMEMWDNLYQWAALRTKEEDGQEWKYVEWGPGDFELYDLVGDPYELESLHADPAYAATLADLQARRALHPRMLSIPYVGRAIPPATAGVAYEHTLPIWGGDAPYSWDSNQTELPPGLGIDSSTGIISGLPTVAAEWEFQIRVTDSGVRSHAGGPRRFVKDVTLRVDPGDDVDGDGSPFGVDNCPNDYNPGQQDSDSNGIGNACDPFWVPPAVPALPIAGRLLLGLAIASAAMVLFHREGRRVSSD